MKNSMKKGYLLLDMVLALALISILFLGIGKILAPILTIIIILKKRQK